MILFRDRAATVLFEVLATLEKNTTFLLPLNICPVVPDTFLKANLKFKFIDIDPNTLCMDQALALNAIKNDRSISGVLFVNTFGIEIDSEVFYRKIKSVNSAITIIDDQCLSVQNFDINIEKSSASLSLFSSGYSKYVDLGYGGFGFLKDKEFIKIFKDNSRDKDFLAYQIAVNAKIPLMKKHKARLNGIYKKGIPSYLHLGEAFESWRFSILIDNKEQLLEEILQEDELFASSHYAAIDYKYVDNPIQNSNAQIVGSRILNLFNDFRFTDEKAERVVKIINNFIKGQVKPDP